MADGEWWDVIDDFGTPTGETFRRGAPAWPAGRFHLIVATCVVRGDGLVLMTRRASTKEFPLAWEFPGGSALAGETSRQAAARELREETGVVVPARDLEIVGRFAESSALLDMYVAVVPGVPVVIPDHDEVDVAEWGAIGDVEARLAAGQMADPWVDRLGALWPAVRAVAGIDGEHL